EDVLLVDGNHPGRHRFIGLAEGHDDDAVARGEMPRRRAVDDDLAAAFGQFDGVGLDALAVVDVPDRDLLARNDVDAPHEGRIDTDAADVVQVGACHGRLVDLRLADRPQFHGCHSPPARAGLSSAMFTTRLIPGLSSRARLRPTRIRSLTSTSNRRSRSNRRAKPPVATIRQGAPSKTRSWICRVSPETAARLP